METHGLDVIADTERKGTPRTLFWPWFGADVSILGLGYGAFALGFGISFWQALAAGVVGIVFSFLLCGFVTVAGKRGSAPTMVLGRAAYGVRGNRLPSVISWVPLLLTLTATALGWGLVTNSTATWLDRQGYLLHPLGRGGRSGPWAYANLGVLAALALTYLGTLTLHRDRVHEQETLTPSPATDEGAPL